MSEDYADEDLQVSDSDEIESSASQIGSDSDIQLSISYRSTPSPNSAAYQPSTRSASPSIPTDEGASRLLKSRLPNKTLILDKEHTWSNLQCPLRKGIIYYSRDHIIFEHDLYSSSKHEPRIIAKLQATSMAYRFQIAPINHNRILLIGMSFEESYVTDDTWHYLHISIHEICSYRVGPALWTYHDWGQSNIFELQLMESTTNTVGITFGVNSKSHMELFDVRASTGAEKHYPLIEAGRLNYSLQLDNSVVLSPDRRILLNATQDGEIIDIFYSGSGDTNNMNFSFVTHVPIPNPNATNRTEARFLGVPSLEFSADGSKIALATADGVVSVWDVRNKHPLKVFTVDVPRHVLEWPMSFLQFSSGISGREVLVFIENEVSTGLKIVHLIDATSFETEETLLLPRNKNYYRGNQGTSTLFFEPSGGSMYASFEGTLYQWDLRENEGLEWWLGEE